MGAILIFIFFIPFHVKAISANSQSKLVIIQFQNLWWFTLSHILNWVISLLTFGLITLLTSPHHPQKLFQKGLELFQNKVLCNSTLWKIYKEKKITKEEFAEILNVSLDYIDWLEKKIYNKPSK